MIDHISIGVTDFRRSLAFYDSIMPPLGFKRLFAMESVKQIAAYGSDRPVFWIGRTDEEPFNSIAPSPGFHLALQASNRSAVDAFYQAAIAAGGIDDGKPGLRPQYHPNYYAAFVLDPDGYKIEAVCHQ